MGNNNTEGGRSIRCPIMVLFCFLTVGFSMTTIANAENRIDMIQIMDSDRTDRGHTVSRKPIKVKVSSELADNRIGGDYGSDHPGSEAGIYGLGLKWLRIGFWDSSLNWQEVESVRGNTAFHQNGMPLFAICWKTASLLCFA